MIIQMYKKIIISWCFLDIYKQLRCTCVPNFEKPNYISDHNKIQKTDLSNVAIYWYITYQYVYQYDYKTDM